MQPTADSILPLHISGSYIFGLGEWIQSHKASEMRTLADYAAAYLSERQEKGILARWPSFSFGTNFHTAFKQEPEKRQAFLEAFSASERRADQSLIDGFLDAFHGKPLFSPHGDFSANEFKIT